MMPRIRAAAWMGLVMLGLGTTAQAEPRQTLGIGRLFSNDKLGDGQDRWRTGSYMMSIMRGHGWAGTAPSRPGDLLEYRLRSELITPGTPRKAPPDRPYVGAVSAGVFSHWTSSGWDLVAGAELTAIGPSTGMSWFHETTHDILSFPKIAGADTQLSDRITGQMTAEAARPIQLGQVTARPFVTAQLGTETMARVGADLFYGFDTGSDLLTRDPVTGQLLRAIEGDGRGVAFTLGADWAKVTHSAYLPQQPIATGRSRLRAGIHWQMADDMSFFYGATWLSPEFSDQSSGQVLGSLKVNFNF